MARRKGVSGPHHSETLLKGEACLWLGFHIKASDYLAVPITHHFFQKRVLDGHIGKVRQAGLYGAEVEFPVDSKKGSVRLNLCVDELLPLTAQEVSTLTEHISQTGEIQVSTQTKTAKTNTIKKSTNTCSEKGCSFSSPSPQGLGTHRMRTHNLKSRSQQRGTRKVAIKSTPTSAQKATTSTNASTTDWKAKHDALVKKYNRLSTKYESIVKTLKQLSHSA